MFKNRLILLLCFGLILAGLEGCGGGASSPSIPTQTPTGSLPIGELEHSSIVLESTNLIDVDAFLSEVFFPQVSSPGSCTLRASGQEANGACLTPVNISGYASAITLSGDNSNGPGRLFGSTSYNISLDRNGELEVSRFNLKDPVTMRASSNIEDAPIGTVWNKVAVFTAVMDVQAEINGQFWNVRFAFVSQQPADEDIFEDCVDEFYLERIRANSGLLSEGNTTGTYRKGDMMVCIKNDPDTVCEDEEFVWLDLDSGMFVSTRPSNPHQHYFADVFEPSCESANPGYEISLGGYDLIADLDTPFELSAEFPEGTCLKSYTYTDPLTSEETEGNTLSAEFDYDMSESVFLEQIDPDDVDSTSDEDLFRAFTLQQLWVRNTFPDPTAITGDDIALSAAPEIIVSRNDQLSCSDGSDIDSRYLTGADCSPDGEIRTDCTYEMCQPGFDEVEGTIWSVADNGGCNEYCTVQSCADFGGSVRHIYCAPDCGGE